MSQLPHIPVTEEEKREALDALLASASFRRHEQLQRFLRYVCDLEMAGRANEIHEYQIGIDVFGKSSGYSTGEDTAVRTRAHALRRKLLEYYSTEASGAPIRIDMPRGSYVPVFVRSLGRFPDPGVVDLPVGAPAEPPVRAAGRPWALIGAAFAAGVVVAAILAVVVLWNRAANATPEVDPVIRSAWGPLLGPAAKTVVFVATPAHLFVRRLPSDSAEIETSGRPLGQHELPQSADLREWYFGRYADVPGTKPYLIPTHNSPLWGDASGALTAVGLLARSGTPYEIVPERASSAFSLRDRNAVVFGRPEYSAAAEFFLSDKPMSIEYSKNAREYVVKVACGSGTEKKHYADSAKEAGRPRDDARYGLITVLSSGSQPGGNRTVLFSGLASAGTQAAAEYFSSPAHLRQLAAKFSAEGINGFPGSYQVLLRARAIAILPVHIEYVSHCIIDQ
jgi:hypothetical protein